VFEFIALRVSAAASDGEERCFKGSKVYTGFSAIMQPVCVFVCVSVCVCVRERRPLSIMGKCLYNEWEAGSHLFIR